VHGQSIQCKARNSHLRPVAREEAEEEKGCSMGLGLCELLKAKLGRVRLTKPRVPMARQRNNAAHRHVPQLQDAQMPCLCGSKQTLVSFNRLAYDVSLSELTN